MGFLVEWGGPLLQQAVVLGLLLCLVGIPLAWAVARYRNRTFRASHALILALTLLYSAGVISFTFFPLPDNSFQCNDALYYTRYFPGWSLEYAVRMTETLAMPGRLLSWWFLQIALNLVLFVPLGIFCRWLLATRLRTQLFLGFGTSLAIELTQLTAIWGLYECRYRSFDVDDIIANTLGSLLGWALVVALEMLRDQHSLTQKIFAESRRP